VQSKLATAARRVNLPEAAGSALLGPGDPAPVVQVNPLGGSRLLLIGDHAGVAVPAALGDLGVPAPEWERHIALDIGVMGLGTALAARLDARFVAQAYSRLVIDCNRAPDAARAIVEESDGTWVPGNAGIGADERRARVEAIHAPYQAAIGAALSGIGPGAALVALHSFTPVMGGEARRWDCGVLHLGDSALSLRVLDALRAEGDLVVGDNEPYRMEGTDYTVPHHAAARGVEYVEIEVRQDLIAGAAGQRAWAERLARVLAAAG